MKSALSGTPPRIDKVNKILSSMEEQQDPSYAHFLAYRIKASSRPETIMGVRMKVLRDTSKKLALLLGEDEALRLLYPIAKKKYEYKIVLGGVLERVSTPLVAVPFLFALCDGWAVPDYYKEILSTFAQKFGVEDILVYLKQYAHNDNPFARRLSVVAWLGLIKKEVAPVESALEHCTLVEEDDNYYVQMATAWLLAELSIGYPQEFQLWVKEHGIRSPQVERMFLQKRRDSLRVPSCLTTTQKIPCED